MEPRSAGGAGFARSFVEADMKHVVAGHASPSFEEGENQQDCRAIRVGMVDQSAKATVSGMP